MQFGGRPPPYQYPAYYPQSEWWPTISKKKNVVLRPPDSDPPYYPQSQWSPTISEKTSYSDLPDSDLPYPIYYGPPLPPPPPPPPQVIYVVERREDAGFFAGLCNFRTCFSVLSVSDYPSIFTVNQQFEPLFSGLGLNLCYYPGCCPCCGC